jgi:lysozyme
MSAVLSLRPRTRLQKATAAAALAISLVGGFEGLRLTAYRDVVGVATLCYGETRGIRMGMTATKAECDAMLLKGLQEFEQGVLACTKVEMPMRRQVAMVSFAYNVGVGAYCGSSVVRLLNDNKPRAACDALLKWNKAGGVVFPGLTRRRQAERELCLSEAA